MKKKDSRKTLWEKRKKEKICVYCGKNPSINGKVGCVSCLDKKTKIQVVYDKKYKDNQVLYRKSVRKFVINKYGGECGCCGEKELLFLTIDHKNNDGHIERKKVYKNGNPPSSTSFYLKLKREPKREDIQVLCFNCNLGRSMNGGICPHIKPGLESYDKKEDLRHKRELNIGCKIDWDNDELLIEKVNNFGIKETAKRIGVHSDSIRHRLQTRNLYHLVKKYKKYNGIQEAKI